MSAQSPKEPRTRLFEILCEVDDLMTQVYKLCVEQGWDYPGEEIDLAVTAAHEAIGDELTEEIDPATGMIGRWKSGPIPARETLITTWGGERGLA